MIYVVIYVLNDLKGFCRLAYSYCTYRTYALILADPDYDLGLKEKEKVATALGCTGKEAFRGALSRDLRGMGFARLPATKE